MFPTSAGQRSEAIKGPSWNTHHASQGGNCVGLLFDGFGDAKSPPCMFLKNKKPSEKGINYFMFLFFFADVFSIDPGYFWTILGENIIKHRANDDRKQTKKHEKTRVGDGE